MSNLEDVARALKMARDPFGALTTTGMTQLIELKSGRFSKLRDIKEELGSGTVSNDGDEYKLATTASANDAARLRSAERARYIPGIVGRPGLGFRLGSHPTGNQIARWGMFDSNEGFQFGEDETNPFVRILRDGSEKAKVYQGDWNLDRLDGSGDSRNPSHMSLDNTAGQVYHIFFPWYGYGGVVFVVNMVTSQGLNVPVPVHGHKPTDGELSLLDPNLPIKAEVENGSTAEALEAFVSGRGYTIFGPYQPNRRKSGHRVTGVSLTTSFTNLITFRRKAGFTRFSVKLNRFGALATGDLIYEIRQNPGLTGATWGTPVNTAAGEAAVEVSTDATVDDTGDAILDQGIIEGSTGAQKDYVAGDPIEFDFIEQRPVSFVVKALSGTPTMDAFSLSVREEW